MARVFQGRLDRNGSDDVRRDEEFDAEHEAASEVDSEPKIDFRPLLAPDDMADGRKKSDQKPDGDEATPPPR